MIIASSGIPLSNLELMFFSPVFASAVILLYHSLRESTPWQGSLGKKICGVVVTDLHGHRISFPRALKRNSAKCITFLPYFFARLITDQSPLWQFPSDLMLYPSLLGCGVAVASLHKQCLHDAVADTLVRPAGEASPITLEPEPTGRATRHASHARTAPGTSPAPTSSSASSGTPGDDMKECPACAEWIKKKAKKCRYCQERFED